MGSVNKVILVGNLGADPEVRYLQNGTAVCNMRIATSEQWNDRDGNRQERTEWHRIEVWGKQAESCGKYLQKGRQVYVEGSIKTSTYTDKEGVERKSVDIRAHNVTFLAGGDKPQGRQGDWGGGGGGLQQGNQHGGQGQGSRGGQGGNWGGNQRGGWNGQGSGGQGGGGRGDDPIPF